MAKALIIKGADFSTNKLTTISFGETPCTGIALESDSISVSGYTPVEVGYTVTPANTTDLVTWESSDENIITVSGGVITPVGVGSCTLTVSCGEYSDTATVEVTLSYIASYMFGQLGQNGSTPNDFVTVQPSQNRIAVLGSGNQAGTYKCYGKNGASSQNIIKLPKNVASVTVKNTSKNYVHDGTYTAFYWLKDESCGVSGFEQNATYVSHESFNFYTNQEKTFTKPSGADACMMVIRTASSYTEGDNPATVMSNMGFSLTFNAAE